MKQILAAILCGLVLFQASLGLAIPLQTYQDFVTANPIDSRRGQWVQLLARGEGTNDQYVIEVDPITGALPVEGNITATNPSVSVIGDPVPLEGTYIAGINPSGDLQGVSVEADGSLNVNATFGNDTDYGAVGVNTLRTAAQIGNATGAADFGAGNSSAQTLRTVIATDQTAIPVSQSGNWSTRTQDGSGNAITSTGGALDVNVTTGDIDIRDLSDTTDSVAVGDGTDMLAVNADGSINVAVTAALPAGTNNIGDVDVTNLPTTVATNAGAADASTIRVITASNSPAPGGRTYADSARLSYSSNNVTTGAWVEVDASTAATFNAITLFSSCASSLELGVGAAASESRVMIIPPGGIDGQFSLAIASGSRLSVRSLDTTCSAGELTITGFQ